MAWTMDRTLDRGGLIGIALLAVLMIATAVVNYRNTLLLNENGARLSEAHEVIELTNGILLGLVNMETGERGFLLTGSDEFLRPYTNALPLFSGRLDRLEMLIRANPVQHARIDKLQEMARGRLALLKDRIELRRQRQPDVGIEKAAAEGIVQMDGIRSLIAEMEVDAHAELEKRARQSVRAFRLALTTGVLAAIAGLLFLAGFVTLLNRSLASRQVATQLLARQNELFKTTLASIGDAVITTDNSGRVTFLNRVAEGMTGWTNELARGKTLESVFQILHEDTRQPFESPAARALREGTIIGQANHTILVSRDGSECAIDDSAAPIRNEDGAVSGVVLVFRDITERLQAEKDLLAADRLKDEYLAMLAHELRNPLAPIRNSLEIMKQAAATDVMREQAREMAERQVKHMALLLDDLLDVARISSGRIELRLQTIDLVALTQRTVDAVRPFVEQQKHEIAVNLPRKPIYLQGDPTRLDQVLTNLLNNAAKYTPPGGKLWLTLAQEGREIRVHVRDNGIGIPTDVLPRIFDLFVQVQRREDRSQGGIGIGLTLVRKLVELHQGRVEARSAGPGQGSEFVVHLPACADSSLVLQPVPAVSEHNSRPRGLYRILVVDDNKDAAETLAMLLRLTGHQVRLAFDGPAALTVAHEFKPQLMFLDIGMPGMDGYEVASAVRADDQIRPLTLVALTGWGQEEDRRRSREAGFDHHLVKPVEPAVLEELIVKWKLEQPR
jgi:PAS domain S-box-containing protein